MENHKDLKKRIAKEKLISEVDYFIACGDIGWSDLRFTRLNQRLTDESHYGIALMLEDKPVIFQLDNLKSLVEEINEDFVKNKVCTGFDYSKNRVHVHYEGENIFRFGNKTGEKIFRKEFNLCTMKDLARRNDYGKFIELLSSDEKHRAIQVLLAELGIELGFKIKIARNDQGNIIKNNPNMNISGKLLTMMDLDLGNIKEEIIRNSIDLIDVIWCESISNKPVAAFEVELNRKYNDSFVRFSSILQQVFNSKLLVIGDDYTNYSTKINHPLWKDRFKNKDVGYMTIQNLAYILNHYRTYNSVISKHNLYELFFSDKSVKYLN